MIRIAWSNDSSKSRSIFNIKSKISNKAIATGGLKVKCNVNWQIFYLNYIVNVY